MRRWLFRVAGLPALAAVATLAAVAALVPGCGGGHSCTLVACASLTVVLRVHDAGGAFAAAFHGTLTPSGAAATSFACGGSNPASGAGFSCTGTGEVTLTATGAPSQLVVQADGASGSFAGSLSSVGAATYPNGVDCAPECYAQPVVVTLR